MNEDSIIIIITSMNVHKEYKTYNDLLESEEERKIWLYQHSQSVVHWVQDASRHERKSILSPSEIKPQLEVHSL